MLYEVPLLGWGVNIIETYCKVFATEQVQNRKSRFVIGYQKMPLNTPWGGEGYDTFKGTSFAKHPTKYPHLSASPVF